MSIEGTDEGIGPPGHAHAAPPLPPAGDGGRRDRLALWSAGVPFRIKLTIVWIAIFGVLAFFLSLVEFDWPWIRDNYQFILKGLRYTVQIAIGAIVLAVVLAALGALGRLSSNPIAFGITGFYTSFFRGTPLLVQLFLIYLALPQVGNALDDRFGLVWASELLTLAPVPTAILGLGLNYGAYMTEIFRAGIQSVGHGQGEAADALGMSYSQKMRRVVLPQAIRVIIPPTGNEFIAMMKDTALIGTLGVPALEAEIFRRAQLMGREDFRNLEAFIIAAAIYWGLTAIFSFFQLRLERRMGRGYVRTQAAPSRRRRVKITSMSKGGGLGGGGQMPSVTETDENEGGP